MKYLAGTFTPTMLKGDMDFAMIRVRLVDPKEIPEDVECLIGNLDLVRVVKSELGYNFIPRQHNRITLEKGDILYVARYQGPYLQKGTTKLPRGAELKFFEFTVNLECEGCEFSGGDCR